MHTVSGGLLCRVAVIHTYIDNRIWLLPSLSCDQVCVVIDKEVASSSCLERACSSERCVLLMQSLSIIFFWHHIPVTFYWCQRWVSGSKKMMKVTHNNFSLLYFHVWNFFQFLQYQSSCFINHRRCLDSQVSHSFMSLFTSLCAVCSFCIMTVHICHNALSITVTSFRYRDSDQRSLVTQSGELVSSSIWHPCDWGHLMVGECFADACQAMHCCVMYDHPCYFWCLLCVSGTGRTKAESLPNVVVICYTQISFRCLQASYTQMYLHTSTYMRTYKHLPLPIRIWML